MSSFSSPPPPLGGARKGLPWWGCGEETDDISDYSRLSLKGHLYKTDNSLKRTPTVVTLGLSLILLVDCP